jgi:hypothetical protein
VSAQQDGADHRRADPRDWTKEHEITRNTVTAYVKVENGKFVPTFNEPGKPFMCLPDQPATLPAKATFQ